MTRTFRIRSLTRQLWPLVITCLVTMGILLVVTDADSRPLLLIVGAVLVLAVLLAAWLLSRTKLEIGPEGVTYHAIGYRVRGRWPDVLGYDHRLLGASDVESLILRQSGLEMAGWLAAGSSIAELFSWLSIFSDRPQPRPSWRELGDAIPVGTFDSDWRNGEIGALVRQYAPTAMQPTTREV